MKTHRIAIFQCHPDPSEERLCDALGERYARAARGARHEVRVIRTADLDFDCIRTQQEFEESALPPSLAESQEVIRWCDHLVIIFPLWLGDLPGHTKCFWEQIMRPGFALGKQEEGFPQRLLKGKSARLITTMGMPALAYRLAFGAFGVRAFDRSVLRLSGISPVRHSFAGQVHGENRDLGALFSKIDRLARRAG
ncbi:NAD(P)H-dependent oxidoreductase [Pacificimonas sp. WHA3]|uniref:NAD(P)H-dependent oxidoreductase n=1 Tax=Pacificimonas pallii TaxID=2827236 RepID=A0ABS6SE13_9SPHN|nr:NAD(P)H-dependent oxidoreductase [Pacificimonas pallii]MBV7256600.1 NAD(P)H-dependent oxidoreductase [Pacificimonas pallii]